MPGGLRILIFLGWALFWLPGTLVLPATAAAAAATAAAAAADEVPANNEIALLIRVQRDGRLWSLSEIPSLRYGDFLHVRFIHAREYHEKAPHVVRQRVQSMASDHGFMVVGAFVRPTDRSGLGPEAFAQPFLSRDGSELLFRVERDGVTPFVLLIPALYDGGREGEWKDFIEDIIRKPELKALRDFLLREFSGGTLGGEVGLVYKEGDDPDQSLRAAQFLLPRIAAANQERSKPDFKTLSRSQQTERLYSSLGVDLPDRPGAYEYINTFLDAFVPADPTRPVQIPERNAFGALLKEGLTFLPAWYSAPLRSLELFGKVSLLFAGLNQRPKPDEKYFVSVRWSPKAAKDSDDIFLMDPIERLEVKGGDGRRRKNVLIACLGRTGFQKATVKATVPVPNQGGIVYLSNVSQTRTLSFDSGSGLSPEQLRRFAGTSLTLKLQDGSEPIPLTYEPRQSVFLLASARPLPLKPTPAVIRGDWGHTGKVEDLSERFLVCGVERGAWSVENGLQLTAGSPATLRLRAEKPIRPWQVILRYTNGGMVTAQSGDIAEVPKEPGVYAVKLDLTGQRPGPARLEVYKPPMDTPPDIVEAFRAPEGGELRLQVFSPLRPLAPTDLRYYAYDSRLLLKTGIFDESTLPQRITLGDSTFERGSLLDEGWLVFETRAPVTRPGAAQAVLHLQDGRVIPAAVRIRPRRPAFTVQERLRENPPAPFPFQLPEKVATQYSALEIRLTAAEGYSFPGTAQLAFGPILIKPDIIPTGARGADTITFTLDPRTYSNLRGELTTHLTETRDGGEVVTSGDFVLGYTLTQLPDLPLSLRVIAGKYRLIGQNVNVFERAGTAASLQPIMATGTGATQYLEFSAPAGLPLYFQPRMLSRPLLWNGPIVPQTPPRPAVNYTPGEKPVVTLKWSRAAGATEYRLYRGTDLSVPLENPNRIATIPASDAPDYTYTDTDPLEPGTVYRYRLVAVNRQEGFSEEQFPEKDFSAVGEPSEPMLTRPGAPLTVAVGAVTVNEKAVPEVRFSRAAGATQYRLYRGTGPTFDPTPENKVGEVAGTGAESYAWQDPSPLTPGVTYHYKVIAVTVREGVKEAVSPPSPPSNGYEAK